MSSYSQKIIQNLKPGWYLDLSNKEKLEIQDRLRKEHKEAWGSKPEALTSGTILTAKVNTNSLTKGRIYVIQGHFCTLITTLYGSEWNQFVTLKNDSGWTVKMNLNNFELAHLKQDNPMDRIKLLEHKVRKLRMELNRIK